jgi:hypothetical protein
MEIVFPGMAEVLFVQTSLGCLILNAILTGHHQNAEHQDAKRTPNRMY